MYVGISIHFDDNGVNDIFANGAIQNIIFLYQILKKNSYIKKISLVFLGNGTTPHKNLRLDGLDITYEPLDKVVHKLNLLIEGTVMLEPKHADAVHRNNGKVVSYRMGNDFILEMESFLFNRDFGRYLNGVQFDEIWTIPQHEKTCKSYFGIMNRCPVRVLPHIWMSTFFDKLIQESNNISFGYIPNFSSKRISNFEPNSSVLKTCYIPILICENLYRNNPQLIKHVYLCNTYDKKDRNTFYNFIGRTDLVKNNILTVEGRHWAAYFLAKHTDIVIAHQWENALNYIYYEALYGGYPLIHNSKMLPVGYYYNEFDAEDGSKVLLDVIKNHDYKHEEYIQENQKFLDTLSINNILNIQKYSDAILDLFKSQEVGICN